MCGGTFDWRVNGITPKMILPPTINRFAPDVHELGAQSIHLGVQSYLVNGNLLMRQKCRFGENSLRDVHKKPI